MKSGKKEIKQERFVNENDAQKKEREREKKEKCSHRKKDRMMGGTPFCTHLYSSCAMRISPCLSHSRAICSNFLSD